MSSQQNIVVLGGSMAGLGIAHYLLKHVIPSLSSSKESTYKLILVNPSTHYYHRIAVPRGIISPDGFTDDQLLFPLADGFKQYPSSSYELVLGLAKALDPAARTVTVALTDSSETKTIPYHALVIATGGRTPWNVASSTGPLSETKEQLAQARAEVAAAKTVVVGGGGPVGVESAGEIGEFLNGSPGWFQSAPASQKAEITIVTGGDKLLPVLRPALGKKAERYLARVGVKVKYNTKITSTNPAGDGSSKTAVHLSNGEVLTADLYIPATGLIPNTDFLPDDFLDTSEKGNRRLRVNDTTLRVDSASAGPRVYGAGDVGTHSRGGALEVYSSVPVLATNLKHDLEAAAGGKDKADSAKDRAFKANFGETQLVPVGKSKGVGAFGGWAFPSIMVWLIKGRDYFLGKANNDTVHGGQWVKPA